MCEVKISSNSAVIATPDTSHQIIASLSNLSLPSKKSISSKPADSEALTSSRVHFNERYCEVKFLGSGDNGDTYAAICKENAATILAKHDFLKTKASYNELRENLVAVKFYKDNNVEGDLQNEIEFLNNSFTESHLNMTAAIDSHWDSNSMARSALLWRWRSGQVLREIPRGPFTFLQMACWTSAGTSCSVLVVRDQGYGR